MSDSDCGFGDGDDIFSYSSLAFLFGLADLPLRSKIMNKYFLYLAGFLLIFTSLTAVSPAQVKMKAVERETDFDEAGQEETLNRELWESIKRTPYEAALRHIERVKERSRPDPSTMVLPNGWQIAPAGEQTEVGRLPMEAISFAGQIVVLNAGYYAAEKPEISVVDPVSNQVVRIFRVAGLYPGAAVVPGADLFVSGGVSKKIFRFDKDFRQVREYDVNGFVAGLSVIDADHIAAVYLVAAETPEDFQKGVYREGRVAIINTSSGMVEHEVSAGFYPQAVQFQSGKLYVTLSGENKLRIFDTELSPIGELAVGKTPQKMCSDGERLFVVNQNSDNLSVVDTGSDKLVSTISVAWPGSTFGSAPTSCTVKASRLYVTQANTNDIAVLDLRTGRVTGYIPTGFYPTKVMTEGNRLVVLNGKGVRPRRPNVDGPQTITELGGPQYVLTLLKGSVATIPIPDIPAKLPAWTAKVKAGTPYVDPRSGVKLPIKHIFYIVRENRTYDQVLGDLPRGDGDKFLTLFGRAITPNAHRLSEDFVTLDNYYADGEISVLGHSFTTSGYASPFLEWLGNAAYSGRYAGYPFGMVPVTTSPAYLWDALDDKKVDYRIYGENYFLYTRAYRILREQFGDDSAIARKYYAQMMSYASIVDRGNLFNKFARSYYGQMDTVEDASNLLKNAEFAGLFSKFLCGDDALVKPLADDAVLRGRFAEYLTKYPSNYRSWDLNTSDLERAAAWKTDFDKQIAKGRVANLNYLWLPNDHTGNTLKKLTPQELVAQNDAALGLIVDSIAASPVWKDSIILVTEDDAQNGPDHVDATRTVALAIGPYVKRNVVVHDRLDQLSMLRTIELMLGLSPLNLNDALAVPMFGILRLTPDLTKPTPATRSDSLSETDLDLYQNFSRNQ